MTEVTKHNWNRVNALYDSLIEHGWKHIPAFKELIPEVKSCAEKLSLTPVTSHECLLLSKYSEYPMFFDNEHLVIQPLPNETILIEVWNKNYEKVTETSYHRSDSLPHILEAINKHFGDQNAV